MQKVLLFVGAILVVVAIIVGGQRLSGLNLRGDVSTSPPSEHSLPVGYLGTFNGTFCCNRSTGGCEAAYSSSCPLGTEHIADTYDECRALCFSSSSSESESASTTSESTSSSESASASETISTAATSTSVSESSSVTSTSVSQSSASSQSSEATQWCCGYSNKKQGLACGLTTPSKCTANGVIWENTLAGKLRKRLPTMYDTEAECTAQLQEQCYSPDQTWCLVDYKGTKLSQGYYCGQTTNDKCTNSKGQAFDSEKSCCDSRTGILNCPIAPPPLQGACCIVDNNIHEASCNPSYIKAACIPSLNIERNWLNDANTCGTECKVPVCKTPGTTTYPATFNPKEEHYEAQIGLNKVSVKGNVFNKNSPGKDEAQTACTNIAKEYSFSAGTASCDPTCKKTTQKSCSVVPNPAKLNPYNPKPMPSRWERLGDINNTKLFLFCTFSCSATTTCE